MMDRVSQCVSAEAQDTRIYSSITVSDLDKMIGVNLFSQHGGKKRKSQAGEEFTLRDFSRSIIDAIKRVGQH